MNLASLESELKTALTKVEHLLYTPQTKHPILEDFRQLIVKEIQAHLGAVTNGVLALGNTILQQLEQSLAPASTGPSSAKE